MCKHHFSIIPYDVWFDKIFPILDFYSLDKLSQVDRFFNITVDEYIRYITTSGVVKFLYNYVKHRNSHQIYKNIMLIFSIYIQKYDDEKEEMSLKVSNTIHNCEYKL